MKHVAVIDIGKTNAKLALVEAGTLREVAVVTRPNTVRPGPPWPHFDVEGHWDFFLHHLAAFHAAHGVDAISVTTHGASAVLLDAAGGLAAPMLDDEYPGPDDLAADFAAIRPALAETGSARLPGGLNLGAQLFWLLRTDPGLRDRVAQVLTYPGYWGWRLTGQMACDVTSLGCHTDLWKPATGRFSALVARLGLTDKMAPPHFTMMWNHTIPRVTRTDAAGRTTQVTVVAGKLDKAQGPKFFKRFFHQSRLNYVVDALFFVAMTAVRLSGLMISKDIMSLLGIQLDVSRSWKTIHNLASDASIILLGIHFALHWKWVVTNIGHYIVNPIRNLFQPQTQARKGLVPQAVRIQKEK